MKLKVKCLDLEAGGKTIAIFNREDAEDLGVHPLDRVVLSKGKRKITVVVNVSDRFVRKGEVVIYHEVKEILKLKNGDIVEAVKREELQSKKAIRKKIDGHSLNYQEIKSIVQDLIERDLNDLEIASFVTALHIHGLGLDETVSLIKAMIETGKQLKLNKKIIVDKHSLGGVPGDKTSILLVPIVASLGLTIPKTSSRAITSPAGTADRFECLAPVNLDLKEMERVVKKTNGCIVWGGELELAPADDLFIQIERPLNIDPLYIPSIIAKKKSVGSNHLVLDLPTGRGTKLKTFGDAYNIASEFLKVNRILGIKTVCGITFGEQPIGYAVGPALEAREALTAIMTGGPEDLVNKAVSLAGALLELIGKGNKKTAMEAFRKKAEKKLREIIREQGGNERIKPDDIPIGDKTVEIRSQKKGIVRWVRNEDVREIAKLAGAPKDKGAGLVLKVKIGDVVKKGDVLFTIYSENSIKLREAERYARENNPIMVIDRLSDYMLIKKIRAESYEKSFIMER